MFCLFLSLFDANIQSTTNDDLTHLFQGKGGYIVPIKMLKSSPKAEDGHGDSVLLSKHAGSSSFQVKTFVKSLTNFRVRFSGWIGIIQEHLVLGKVEQR
jgi:hypothetical protein